MNRVKPLVRTEHYAAEKDSLLEYFTETSLHFWKAVEPDGLCLDENEDVVLDENGNEVIEYFTYTRAPQQFADNYFEGNICTERENKYLASDEVISTLKAFHLDIDKFWYLCLGIMDVVEDCVKEAAVKPKWVFDELLELEEALDKLEDAKGLEKSTASLTLDLGDKKLKIEHPGTFRAIKYAIHQFREGRPSSFRFQPAPVGKYTHLKPIYKIALFNKFLAWFMKDKVADKNINASKDKSLLISRMIFILGISDDESFFEEYKDNGLKSNYLKDYIKNYKGVEISCAMHRYSCDAPLLVIASYIL